MRPAAPFISDIRILSRDFASGVDLSGLKDTSNRAGLRSDLIFQLPPHSHRFVILRKCDFEFGYEIRHHKTKLRVSEGLADACTRSDRERTKGPLVEDELWLRVPSFGDEFVGMNECSFHCQQSVYIPSEVTEARK